MNKIIIKLLVLFGSHVAHIISIGMCISFGVLYSEIRSDFQMSQSEASWTASIFNGVLGVVGIPLGAIVPRFGERLTTIVGTIILCAGMITSSFVSRYYILYVTYGLIAGTGSGIIHYCANIILLSNFDSKWRPFAITIANSGAAVSALAMPPFMVACINNYSWRTTFVVLGCISAVGLFCAATFVKPERDIFTPSEGLAPSKNTTTTERDKCDGKTEGHSLKETVSFVLRNADFMIFFTSSVLTFLVVFSPATFLPDLMHESKIAEYQVSWCIIGMGFGNLFGRIISGVVASRFNGHVQLIHGFILLGYAASTFTIAFANNLTTFMVMSVLLGLFTGGYFGLHIAVVAHYLTTEQAAVGFGMILTANGISSTAGMPLSGFVTDYFKSERGSFIFSGCTMMLALVVLCSILVKKCFRKKSNLTKTTATLGEQDNIFVVISASTDM